MNTTRPPCITVPLGGEAHRLARQFATEQIVLQKGKQVYLNTLAVQAVHSYLKWLQVETDLNQGDSWHPGLRALFNVADLVLPGIGKLECRPLLPGETVCSLPPEVTDNRIGYVVVQIDESLRAATVLGFTPMATVEELPIGQLQPLEDLLDRLTQLTQPVTASRSVTSHNAPVNLSQWLQNRFELGWQALEALLGISENLAFSFRSASALREGKASVKGAKLIDLGLQLGSQAVVLLMAITQETEQEVGIQVQLHPREAYLPPSLRLILLSESGETLQEVQSRRYDNYIQLKCFQGLPGESFNIQVAFGEISVTETFVI
jgi:hypothetical protein